LAKETLTTSVRKRVKETLEDERLEDWKNEKVPEKTDDGKDVNMQDRPNQVDEGENADFEGFDD
jgi:hypothetical protein